MITGAGFKKVFISVYIIVLTMCLSAQKKYALPVSNSLYELQIEDGILRGKLKIQSFNIKPTEHSYEKFLEFVLPGSFSSAVPGKPDLPVFSKLVELPSSEAPLFNYEILDSVVFDLNGDFPGYLIMPYTPSAAKRTVPEPNDNVDILDSDLYFSEGNNEIVEMDYVGRMRGVNISRIQLNPFRYDTGTGKLTVYFNIAFSLDVHSEQAYAGKSLSAPFNNILGSLVRDESLTYKKKLISEQPLSMVILSDSQFRDALKPLVTWKQRKGFRVIEAYTSDPEVGASNASIKAYLQNLYDNPPGGMAPPSYLLIAGDVEHVPLSQDAGQITDLYYTTFDGEDDYLPEMFNGRISVKNDTQLTAVVDKILMYEQFGFPDPSFLARSILIAGYDGSYAPVHGNGQIRYASGYYLNPDNGINASIYLHPEAASQDHVILEDISQGAALVNYTGHGEYYGWLDPAFRMGNIDTMKNIHKYGLMIGNGCSTNQFNLSTKDCFAEAVLKVKDRGAIGYIGCTNDSYWDEDYYWSVGVGEITSDPIYEETTYGYYDKVFHHGDEPVADWAPSMGEMIFAGNMTVQESTTSRKKYYWEIYQLMGDPSLVPWFRVPDNPPVQHPGSIPMGTSGFGILASPYDYVAVSADGQLITAAHTDKFGQLYLSIPDTIRSDELEIVVTGDHRQPYIDTIEFINPQLPFLELIDHEIVSESVEADGMISQGESFSLDISLANKGGQGTGGFALLAFSNNDFIEFEDSLLQISEILPGDTAQLPSAFKMRINGIVDDQEPFTIGLRQLEDTLNNVVYIKGRVFAPEFVSGGIRWNDGPYGNGNGIIDPGERIAFSWTVMNHGTYRSDSLILLTDPGLDDIFTALNFSKQNRIASLQSGEYNFDAVVIDDLREGVLNKVPLNIGDGARQLPDTLYLVTGRFVEDFSTGDLTRFHWTNGPDGWQPDSVFYRQAPFSLRSGPIDHGGESTISMEIYLQEPDTMRFDYKVSSESGYDFLRFIVDSSLVDRWSGYSGWKTYSHLLDSGNHLIQWRYTKDGNTTRGEDAAWIDNIIFPKNSFSGRDIGIRRLVAPVDSRSLGKNEKIRLLISNTGSDTIPSFIADVKVDSGAWDEATYNESLLPGDEVIVEFPGVVDMSMIGDYKVYARLVVEDDQYPGNDSSSFVIRHYSYPDLAIETIGADSVKGIYHSVMLRLTNKGNVPLSSFNYVLRVGEMQNFDTLPINLDPGEFAEINLNLIDSSMHDLASGWYQYLIQSVPDSLNENNSVTGSFYWQVLGAGLVKGDLFKVYPNPTKGMVQIRLPGHLSLPGKLDIFNATGTKLYTKSLNSNLVVLDITSMLKESGLYFFRVSDQLNNQIGGHAVIIYMAE